jgi:hypothetical protein
MVTEKRVKGMKSEKLVADRAEGGRRDTRTLTSEFMTCATCSNPCPRDGTKTPLVRSCTTKIGMPKVELDSQDQRS